MTAPLPNARQQIWVSRGLDNHQKRCSRGCLRTISADLYAVTNVRLDKYHLLVENKSAGKSKCYPAPIGLICWYVPALFSCPRKPECTCLMLFMLSIIIWSALRIWNTEENWSLGFFNTQVHFLIFKIKMDLVNIKVCIKI